MRVGQRPPGNGGLAPDGPLLTGTTAFLHGSPLAADPVPWRLAMATPQPPNNRVQARGCGGTSSLTRRLPAGGPSPAPGGEAASPATDIGQQPGMAWPCAGRRAAMLSRAWLLVGFDPSCGAARHPLGHRGSLCRTRRLTASITRRAAAGKAPPPADLPPSALPRRWHAPPARSA